MRIDAHHHFWQYSTDEYGWIDDDMARIRRDFLPPDLEETIAAVGVDGVVSVQARQTIEETQWLLDMADQNDFMRGAVGWVPLVDPGVCGLIAEFARNPKLKAVRHVLQGEPDENYMLRDDFNRGIDALREFGLVYDILIFERHLPQTLTFVDRHPNQVFVLDHIAKPLIRDKVVEPWAANVRRLAERENVYCKMSGLVTEADYRCWSEAQLRPYMDTVLEAFGPERVMFGSDWPVCLVACEYARWIRIVEDVVSELSVSERERVFGGTAIEAYKL